MKVEGFRITAPHFQFYTDRFPGGRVFDGVVYQVHERLLDRMIQMAAYSEEMCTVLRDLFAGSQGYTDLRQRVTGSLPTILKQCGANLLWGSGEAEISGVHP